MNLEIFTKFDPSGSMFKEKFIFKNYSEEWNYINEFCTKHNLTNLPFKEKVYCCVNSISIKPMCKNPNCYNTPSFVNSTIGYRDYCSKKCISSDPNIKKLKEEKSIQNFGTKFPAQSKLIKDKIIQTNNLVYGGNSPMSNNKIKEKSKQKLIDSWGVDNPSKSKILLEKRIESFKKSNYKENFKKKSLEKYGVEHPWMNQEIHKKTIDSFYQRYKDRIISKIDGLNIQFIDFNHKSNTLGFYCNNCKRNFEIISYQFYYRTDSNQNQICTNCFPISENSSLMQIDLLKFVQENYKNEILTNEKSIIKPYEIDIFLPEIKLGFEFNGLWWHSENFKDKTYHKKKFEMAKKSGIQIITIWEDDWVIKKDICKSFILNKLGLNNNKIYARKCIIKEVSYLEGSLFLDDNHLQGNCKSSFRVGLYYEDKLVSLMTFGKLRLPLSSKSTANDWELLRFVNLKNTTCIGSASRLLKYFISKIKPNKVISYSDNLISKGELYEKIGFNYIHTSEPGYWYVINKQRQHRFNWRKSKLVKLGYDKDKTEWEIMNEMGYYRIFNAGNKKWELSFEEIQNTI
jgi:hypothetical protein